VFFVALRQDKTPLGIYPDMKAAQDAIAAEEPDVIIQGRYRIHPIEGPKDADVLKIKLNIHYRLDKFDEAGNLIETLEGEG
jgi:hypothetical protein